MILAQNTLPYNKYEYVINCYSSSHLSECFLTPYTADPSGRSLAGILGSNPAGGMDVCLVSVVCCQVEVSASG